MNTPDTYWYCEHGVAFFARPPAGCACRDDLLQPVAERPAAGTGGLAERAAALAGKPHVHTKQRRSRTPEELARQEAVPEEP